MCTLFIVIIIYFIYNIHSYIFSTELSNFLRHFREGLNRQNPYRCSPLDRIVTGDILLRISYFPLYYHAFCNSRIRNKLSF